MHPPETKPACPTSKRNGLENTDASKVPAGRAAVNAPAEVIELLRRIAELLDDIDASLANLGGKLDQIHGRMP